MDLNLLYGLLGMVGMLVLLMLRVPIVLSMAIPAIIGIWYMKGWRTLSSVIETTIWEHAFSYMLSVIPMFVLMGEFLFVSGVTTDLFSTFRAWFGRLKGGLGIATVTSSAVFSAASGSSIATTGTMGVIASKEMLSRGYHPALTSGSILAGGSLGILIPPSTLLIVYGTLTEASIAGLLLAAIIPGILLTLLFIITVSILVMIKPHYAPPTEGGSWKERFGSLQNTGWILLLFILVIGGMYYGIFTPSEAAGIGAFGAFLIALMKRKINVRSFIEAITRTLETTGFLFAIVLLAFVLNYFFTITRLPMTFSSFFDSLNWSDGATFALIILMYIILGAFMDAMAMIVVTIPIVLPLIMAMDMDKIWFGVIIVLVVEMAFITPPIGMNAFVLKGVAPELELKQIFKGGAIFIIPILVMVVLLYFFPEIAMFLPNTMR